MPERFDAQKNLKFHIQLPVVLLAAEKVVDRLPANVDDFYAVECVEDVPNSVDKR